MKGLERIHFDAQSALTELLEKYRMGALHVQREYSARMAYLENADVAITDRARIREAVKRERDADLTKLRAQAQNALTETRVRIASLGDDLPAGAVLDLHNYGMREVERAREVVERLRGVSCGSDKYSKQMQSNN